MERWTYLVIAGPDDRPSQLRVMLRDGEDASTWPAAQVGLDGRTVPVDQVAHDYEAPEWQAVQLLEPGGGAVRLEQVKDDLRAKVAS
jgi:hypothetical protein